MKEAGRHLPLPNREPTSNSSTAPASLSPSHKPSAVHMAYFYMCTHWYMYTAGHLWPDLQAGSFTSVHVSHITSCAGNAMYQKSPNHSTLTHPNRSPVRFKTRKCPHRAPAGPGGSQIFCSSQNSPIASQPLTGQLTLPGLWTLCRRAYSGFQNHPKTSHCHR